MAALARTNIQTGTTVYYLSNNYPVSGIVIQTQTDFTSAAQKDYYFLQNEGNARFVEGDSTYSKPNMVYGTAQALQDALDLRI